MAFSSVWDNTQPPDTQAANQLGLDLRLLRSDAQQRMSAVSGPDAGKGALNFKAGFAGILYWAVDTGKVYQWSGTAWADISNSIGNMKNNGKVVPYAAALAIDVTKDNPVRTTVEITLTGNVASMTFAALPGQEVTFIIHQDATGGRTFVWFAGILGADVVDPTPNLTSVQSFVVAPSFIFTYATSLMFVM